MKDVNKGEYGYIEYRKKINTVKTLIGFGIVALILFAGIIICGTKNNICTVIAILAVLPSAKSLVALLMVIRCKSPQKSDYDALKEHSVTSVLLSDCIMSCKDKTVYIEFAQITDSCIYCYTKDQRIGQDFFEKNIADFIKSCGDTVSVKLFYDFNQFSKRVKAVGNMEYKQNKIERIKNDFLILVL